VHNAYRRTIAGLAFFQVVHVLGLLTMLGLLLPGLDPALPYAARAAYVQEHVWRWRIGCFVFILPEVDFSVLGERVLDLRDA
jgi:hypothetical protein